MKLTCPLCKQPVEGNDSHADVYHMACMMEFMKERREKLKQQTEALKKHQKEQQ